MMRGMTWKRRGRRIIELGGKLAGGERSWPRKGTKDTKKNVIAGRRYYERSTRLFRCGGDFFVFFVPFCGYSLRLIMFSGLMLGGYGVKHGRL